MSELNVEIRGRGPKLVLLHGWGLNLRVWDGLVARLEDRFELIAVDLPGHGRSAWTGRARTLEGQFELLAYALAAADRYSVLGWSLGGQLAMRLALGAPDRVERLLLVATTPRFVASPDWPHGMAPEVLRRFADQLASDYGQTVSDFLELQVRGSSDSTEVLRSLRAALLLHGEAHPQALTAGLELLAASDLRRALPDIVPRACVVAGQYDRVTPPGASRFLADALPHARHVQFRRAGHAPFLSHAREFADLASEFLSSDRRAPA